MIIIGDVHWWSFDEVPKPPEGKILMLTGPSGQQKGPTDRFLILGRYDNQFRPPFRDGRIRWLDIHNAALTDQGYEPTHWAECPELP